MFISYKKNKNKTKQNQANKQTRMDSTIFKCYIHTLQMAKVGPISAVTT